VSTVRPRALVHEGRHPAAALLLEAALVPEAEARRRILAAWQPGDRIHAIEGGLLHRFARPRSLVAGEAGGLLLVEERGLLLGLPLAAVERERLAAPPGVVVVARGGEAVALEPGAALDPAAWLSLHVPIVRVEPLGAPPAAPDPAPAPPDDLRVTLGVPAPSMEAGTFAAAMRKALARKEAEQRPRAEAASRQSGTGTVAAFMRGLAGWIIPFASILVAMRSPFTRGDAGLLVVAVLALLVAVGTTVWIFRIVRSGSQVSTAPDRPTGLLGRAWDRLLIATRVSRLAGFRQGAYLMKLLRELDDGDLGEALRRALPLGDGKGDSRIALGIPRRRASLEITFGTGRTAVAVSDRLQHALRDRYRRAFQRLEQLGRHDEAAFVLAELLRSEQEAVAYLERHGRLRQAAELAEGRDLSPGLVIRQWFVAGDHERAIRLARAHRVWADAVDRLERSGKREDAEAMRLRWADDLAEAGDLEGAVRAALPVAAARPLVERWVELAMAADGVAGHLLLGTWADLRPDRFAEVRDRVLVACSDRSDEGPGRRRAITRGLLRARPGAEVRTLARPVARALLADAARGDPVPEQGALHKLAADALLQVDLPSSWKATASMGSTRPYALTVLTDDRGTRAVHDAAVLPGGRVLLALGEGGVRLVTRDGREVARFEVPAHRLVVSDLGNRALAVGGRGEVASVARLDLEARTVRRLRELKLGGFAPTFDGTAWAVQSGNSVLLLDSLRDDLRTLWHVSGLEGWPVALGRPAPGFLAFAVVGREQAEGWCYQDGVLRARVPLDLGPEGVERRDFRVMGFVHDGPYTHTGRWYAVFVPGSGTVPWIDRIDRSGDTPVPLEGVDEILATRGGARLAVACRTGEGVDVRWLSRGHEPPGWLRMEGATSANIRTEGDLVIVSDDAGRVLAVDAARGRLVTDFRV
jgi:hypothetical protein